MPTAGIYNRQAAVAYAHQWAYGRNPAFYDYENLGGDCTNFASQCLYAGGGVMNWTPTFGWYYTDASRKAPAWTGVEYLWNFLIRKNLPKEARGPRGIACAMEDLHPGDLVQLSFTGDSYRHCPVVVAVGSPVRTDTIMVAAHSYDADERPLSTYEYQKARFLHIVSAV